MNNFVTSLIRTYVPIIVGAVVAWLVSKGYAVDAKDADALAVVLTAVFSGVYYFAVRFLESRFPSLGWLLGVRAQPKYVQK